jgi:hypothetical protein
MLATKKSSRQVTVTLGDVVEALFSAVADLEVPEATKTLIVLLLLDHLLA